MFLVLIGIAILAAVKYPDLLPMSRVHWNFGPEWDCKWSGKSEPVCIKKTQPDY
jgi:hypothetical protein